MARRIEKIAQQEADPNCSELISSSAHRIIMQNKERINFISNNHLGFSDHAKVRDAVLRALAHHGTGAGGSPLMGGTTDLHVKLKTKISQIYGQKATALFASGYQAHIGAIQAAVNQKDAILIDDASTHQGFMDGVALSGSHHHEWRHNDTDALCALLAQTCDTYQRRLIIVDSLHSMDGNIAPLPALKKLSDVHHTPILTNEAHALGILGPRGYGLGDYFAMPGSADIIVGTFNPFAGEVGGFVAGPADYIAHLRQSASAYIYSTSLPPVICAAVLAVFEVLDTEPKWRDILWKNTRYFLCGLESLGFDTCNSETPVIPIMIGDTEKTRLFSKKLYEMGICASWVDYPDVVPAKAHLRLSIMATHTMEDLDIGLDAIKTVGKKMGVI